MHTNLARSILSSPRRLAMPIGLYAGLPLTGASVQRVVTASDAQAETALALHARCRGDFLLTAMDLSAEAEAFGCAIQMGESEIPAVIGRRAASPAEIEALPVPQPGAGRTRVHLDAARKLSESRTGVPVLGGLIGPFSLAARIFGVSETLELSATDPNSLTALLDKAALFLTAYAAAFRDAGADGVLMAEPAAGLLSPRALGIFSSAFVRRILESVQTERFAVVLHNCGAKLVHLPAVMESGAELLHFGAPMDLPAALAKVDGRAVLAGNLDPAAVFLHARPDEVEREAGVLLQAAAPYPNFILSSGCDLAPATPLENLDAFYRAVRDRRVSRRAKG